MQSFSYRGVTYTVHKGDEWYVAAFYDSRGHKVRVEAPLKRTAVSAIKAHIDDQCDEAEQPQEAGHS